MKTKLLFTLAIAFLLFAKLSAQITLTSSDLITIGHQEFQANDTLPTAAIFPGPPGTNQVWNFTALHHHIYDTLNFVDPVNTPYEPYYTTANLSYFINTMYNTKSNGIAYLENNTGGLYVEGFTSNMADTAHHLIKEYVTPHSAIMQWPSTYGTNYNDNYTVKASSGYDLFGWTYDSIKIKNAYVSNCNIDAWGNVQTPLGTYPSIRQHRHEVETDSTWAHKVSPSSWLFLATKKDTVDTYTWWTNTAGIGVPVVQMDYNSTTLTASKVKWLYAVPTLGITEEVETFGFAAYPNPANSSVIIQVKESNNYKISVFDIEGKEMKLNQETINNITTINTENLGSGLYLVVLTNKEGNRSVKKISIVH